MDDPSPGGNKDPDDLAGDKEQYVEQTSGGGPLTGSNQIGQTRQKQEKGGPENQEAEKEKKQGYRYDPPFPF